MVTHDLPYALQLCPRSVLLDDGRVVADGPTRELLADADLMREHRLELPYGFDPLSVAGLSLGGRPTLAIASAAASTHGRARRAGTEQRRAR